MVFIGSQLFYVVLSRSYWFSLFPSGSRGSHWFSEVLIGSQWFSEVVSISHWFSVVLIGYQLVLSGCDLF